MPRLLPVRPRILVVDFNNITRFNQKPSIWRLSYRRFERAMSSLKSRAELSGHVETIVYADPSAARSSSYMTEEDYVLAMEARERGDLIVVPEGTIADLSVLDTAHRLGGIVVADDRYRDHVPLGYEWLVLERWRVIRPTSAYKKRWLWEWGYPDDHIHEYYGRKPDGTPIDLTYVREVERATGLNFAASTWPGGDEPIGVHHIARDLGKTVQRVRDVLKELGYSDYLGTVLTDEQVIQVRAKITE